ncbi:MAG: TIGR02652 family protein [Prochlorotrichaceae cyanobacterium]|jgi:uncharacterized protein (TIGR02652 family)
MLDLALQYPIFGPEIHCPHCQQVIPALTLTDTYLCNYHGPFEANPQTQDLVHLHSGRAWRRWDGKWYHQHRHPDGLRFEIHEALDQLYTEGYRAIQIVVADRYRSLLLPYFKRTLGISQEDDKSPPRLYGLPVTFSMEEDPRWSVINFRLKTTREPLKTLA